MTIRTQRSQWGTKAEYAVLSRYSNVTACLGSPFVETVGCRDALVVDRRFQHRAFFRTGRKMALDLPPRFVFLDTS